MNSMDLGIDRTVVATWAPDDTWPMLSDELSDELDDHTADLTASAVAAAAGGGAASGETAESWGAVDDVDADEPPEPVEAVAAIEGHPLHPALVPLPIGAFVGALVCDLAYVRTHDRFWARGARLLTGAGVVSGLLAGSLGALDFTGRREIRSRRAAWVHGAGNLTVLALGAASEMLRTRDERRAVTHGGLALSVAAAGLLAVTGWLGGELAFRDRIGVTAS